MKTISQPEKVRALYLNMLMPVNHILQTVDDVPNICSVKIKPPKKVKSVMTKEAMEQDKNDMTYTIKKISQAVKVSTLHRNMLMSANHILQTVRTKYLPHENKTYRES